MLEGPRPGCITTDSRQHESYLSELLCQAPCPQSSSGEGPRSPGARLLAGGSLPWMLYPLQGQAGPAWPRTARPPTARDLEPVSASLRTPSPQLFLSVWQITHLALPSPSIPTVLGEAERRFTRHRASTGTMLPGPWSSCPVPPLPGAAPPCC